MRGRTFLTVFLIYGIAGCTEIDFPQGLYSYQLERLLSGGDTATWTVTSRLIGGIINSPSDCEDSIRLLFMDTTTDSLDVARLTYQPGCLLFDTIRLGKANASGTLLFTDSLLFESGSHWIIHSITSTSLSVGTSKEVVETAQKSNF